MARSRAQVIAEPEILVREPSITEMLQGSPWLAELVCDGDHATLAGTAARAATLVSDLTGEVTR